MIEMVMEESTVVGHEMDGAIEAAARTVQNMFRSTKNCFEEQIGIPIVRRSSIAP